MAGVEFGGYCTCRRNCKGSKGVGKVYDPGTAIAVPVNTSRQRLAQSGRDYLKN